MATAVSLNVKDDIIEAAAQAILEPFNINKKFYNDIVKKVKSITKTFNKSEQGKALRDNISGVVADIIKSAIPTKIKQNAIISQDEPSVLPSFVQEKIKPVTDVANKVEDVKPKEQASFFENLKSNFLNLFKTLQKPDKPKELDYFVEAQPVFLQEISPEVYNKLTGLIQSSIPKTKKEQIKEDKSLRERFSEGGILGLLPKGLLAMGGGLALLLGGLAALVTGLQTDGQFKGLLKIFSKVGLQGGLKLLEKGAKTFINTLKTFIEAPVKLVDEASGGLKGIFSKIAPKGFSGLLKGSAGLLSRIIVGLGKFLKPILTKLPLIGTVISFGFAYTRFKSGDTVGGIIDILSGLAGLLYLTPAAPLALPLQIGLDVLNAFLDYKAGGATKEASAKKTGILKEWMLGLGKWFKNNAENFPLIGTLIKTGRLFSEGKWTEGLVAFAKIIPGTSWLLDLVGFTEEKQIANVKASQDIIGDLWNWMQTTMWEKITSAASWLVDGVKSWWSNLSWDPSSWVGMAPTPPTLPTNQQPTTTTLPQQQSVSTIPQQTPASSQATTLQEPIKLGEGGFVPKPVNAIVGDKPEWIIPVEKFKDVFNNVIDNAALGSIAENTNQTNINLQALGQAILKLAQIFDNKPNQAANNIFLNGQQQGPIPSASQVAAQNVDPIRQVRRQFMQFAT